jgi:hypothetical protein
MDTIRTAGAQMNAFADELLEPLRGGRTPPAEIRALEDWELMLAGGGDVAPEWPDAPAP